MAGATKKYHISRIMPIVVYAIKSFIWKYDVMILTCIIRIDKKYS